MDTFFATAPFLRRFAGETEIHGNWYYRGMYCHIFSRKSYHHYHDGNSISQTDVTVHRISAKTYYGGKADSVDGNDIRTQWLTDVALTAHESERYFLSNSRFRAKNFLGITGFYEITFSSD